MPLLPQEMDLFRSEFMGVTRPNNGIERPVYLGLIPTGVDSDLSLRGAQPRGNPGAASPVLSAPGLPRRTGGPQ